MIPSTTQIVQKLSIGASLWADHYANSAEDGTPNEAYHHLATVLSDVAKLLEGGQRNAAMAKAQEFCDECPCEDELQENPFDSESPESRAWESNPEFRKQIQQQ